MNTDQIQIEAGWKQVLLETFQEPWFAAIKSFLVAEKQAGKVIYPPGPLIFNAFNKTPFDQVKVVVLGQDPYHNPGEAMGLSFSVPRGVRIPPSLLNIYKELQREFGYALPQHGDLSHWAEQGVLLLNAMLTVEAGKPASHQQIGWQHFTDAVIRRLSEEKNDLVFMLWGKFAQSKKPLIDQSRHHVLEAAHPSPMAGNAFQGCGHFIQANALLEKAGKTPVDWEIA